MLALLQSEICTKPCDSYHHVTPYKDPSTEPGHLNLPSSATYSLPARILPPLTAAAYSLWAAVLIGSAAMLIKTLFVHFVIQSLVDQCSVRLLTPSYSYAQLYRSNNLPSIERSEQSALI